MTRYNKWDLIDKALGSTLKEGDKLLLIELIRRCNYEEHKNWDCWPSVQRLAQVRGMKNERHFKGVDVYLPGLVDKKKRGRKNYYTLNPAAVMELEQLEVTIKHTPALEGVSLNTPAVEVNTPAVEVNTPAVEGANSTVDSTVDSTKNSTDESSAAGASSLIPEKILTDKEDSSLIGSNDPALPIVEEVYTDTPATEGVSHSATQNDDTPATEGVFYEWNGQKIRMNNTGDPFEGATGPVKTVEKVACAKCNADTINGFCWNMDCI